MSQKVKGEETKKSHNLRKVLPIYAENKAKVIWICIFITITGVLGVFIPIISANILSNIADSKFDLALKLAVLFLIINIVKMIFNGLTDFVYVRINAKVVHKLTDKLIRSVTDTKMEKLESVKIGSITERLGMDIHTISISYLQIIDMIFEIITNVAFLLYIAYLNVWLFLILFAYVLVLYAVCAYRARVWIRGRKQVKALKDKARSSYIEQINGVRDVKVLNIKESITTYSNNLDKDTIAVDLKFSDKRNMLRRVQMFVSSFFAVAFIVFGIIFVKKELLLLTGFLVIYSYYGRVEGLVQYISSLKEQLAEGEISASRVFDIIENFPKEEYGTEELENFSGKVELDGVTFSYDKEAIVLDNINMVFEPHKVTAIVGKSGSGKSTILGLLAKLYDTDKGEILFDGKNIQSLTENALRHNIGVVSQSPYIFNTTIRQNLLFIKPDATEKEMIGVLKQAQIYSDIKKLPMGLDSEIGENGIKLSGGQKQRLAIARLLLKNSKVIVFDEATSALDNENQNKIVAVLEKLKETKTIIIVAHRLSTIVGADKIYVIEDGKNIAEGTHRGLMKTCESYKELYELEEQSVQVNKEIEIKENKIEEIDSDETSSQY